MCDFTESQCEEEFSQSQNSDWDGPDTDQMNHSDIAMINDDSGSEIGEDQLNHHDLDHALELLGEEQFNPRKLAKSKRNPNSLRDDIDRIKQSNKNKKRRIILTDDDADEESDVVSVADNDSAFPLAPIDKKPSKLNGSKKASRIGKSVVSRTNNALTKTSSNSSTQNKTRNVNDHYIENGQTFIVRGKRYIVIHRGEPAPVLKNDKGDYEYNIPACFVSNYCTVKEKNSDGYQIWLMAHEIAPIMVTKVIGPKIERKCDMKQRNKKAVECDNQELLPNGSFKKLIMPPNYFADVKKKWTQEHGLKPKLPEVWSQFNDTAEKMMAAALRNRLAVDKPNMVQTMDIFLTNAADINDWKQENPKNLYQKLVEVNGANNIEWFARMWALCSSTGRSIVLDYVSSLQSNSDTSASATAASKQ
jgi:hypothetical protein